MNDSVERVFVFTTGLMIGIISTRTYFKKKYEAIANEEIESCKKVFERKENMKKYDTTSDDILREEKPKKVDEPEKFSYRTEDSKSNSISYSDFYKDKGKPEVVEFMNDIKTAYPVEDEQYEIDVSDYEEDLQYAKVTLAYYMEDGVLMYEDTEEIAADDQTVGIENLSDFVLTDDQTAYFRNPKNCIDYEVVKIDGSYRELVTGDI